MNLREAKRLEREKNLLEEEGVREEFDRNFKTACKEFLETQGYLQGLVRKRKQLIVKDDYGDWYVDDWFKELKHFLESKMAGFKDEWLNDESLDDFGGKYADDVFWMMRFKVTIFINVFIHQIKFC